MKFLFAALFAMFGLIHAGSLPQKRYQNTGDILTDSTFNTAMFFKMFDLEWWKWGMVQGTTAFCQFYDPNFDWCMDMVFTVLCYGHDECSEFTGDLGELDKYFDEHCEEVPDDQILQCARDNVDKCGEYFDASKDCESIINDYVDWVEGQFTKTEISRKSLNNKKRGTTNPLDVKQRLFSKLLKSKMFK